MKTIIGIDPGNVESAYVIWDGVSILEFAKLPNEELLSNLIGGIAANELVIEKIESYGMPVGATIFETVFWSGRFAQAWHEEANRITRKDIKMHLCGSFRAKDGNIRQALIDRFEPDLQPRKRPCGILKGISADVWAALAVCVTWYDNRDRYIGDNENVRS